MESFDIAKRKLQPKVQKDSRYEMAKTSMLNRIKQEAKFTDFLFPPLKALLFLK